MGNFSKISSWILAVAVVFASFGQMQTSPGETPIFPDTQESNIPAYSGFTSQILWGLIDFDSSPSLFNLYSNTDSSEEESKNSIDAQVSRESSLERLSALYLLIARNTDVNPSIGEILYPFHFYF